MKFWAICQIHYLLFPLKKKKLSVIYQTMQKTKEGNNIPKTFFLNLVFPSFHHHIHHHYLCTFP